MGVDNALLLSKAREPSGCWLDLGLYQAEHTIFATAIAVRH